MIKVVRSVPCWCMCTTVNTAF